MSIRIQCTDKLKNVSYIHHSGGHWRCTLANGTSVGLSSAIGWCPDEMALRFALDDCKTADEALGVVKRATGNSGIKVVIYGER